MAAQAAKHLGWPELMPHQRYKLDVALEYNPDTGELYYQTVVNMEPRQGGKTTTNLAVLITRMQGWKDQNAVYTAQTLNDARKKWRNEQCKRIRAVKGWREGRDFRVRSTNGDESIDFLKSGGRFAISAMGESSGHGDTLHLHLCDEAFWHKDARADQGFLPTMATVENPQQYITSAAGTWQSAYLNSKTELGRKAVVDEVDSGICAFIWEAEPGCDYSDRDVWRATIPSLGFTQTEARIAGFQAGMEPGEFARAFLCIPSPPDTGSSDAVDPAVWKIQADRQSSMVGGVVLGVAMTPDRSRTAISVAGRRVEGDWHGEHIRTGSGSGWVLNHLLEIAGSFDDVVGVAIDTGGPAGSLVPELVASGRLPLFKMSGGDFVRSTGAFIDAVKERRFWHYDQEPLTTAVLRSRLKPVGDAKVFRRGDGEEAIAECEALALALGACSGIGELTEAEDALAAMDARGGLFEWD